MKDRANSAPDPVTYLGMSAVVRSTAMREVLRLAGRAAVTNAAVLITGESGSGKELVARAIHHHSLRCGKPWVDVNCAALPEHLMESELFGYEKGAFSGADSTKQGLFELAQGGTLFLDEIAELDSKMQVKLLRILDGAPYYRLGGVRKVSVDVRVLAATNHDLEAAVGAGKFRNDLYHRLNQIPIHVPPLRERKDDIQAIARFILEQINPALRFSSATLAVLDRYPWPGNIREMKNAILRAATFSEAEVIEPEQLPEEFLRPGPVSLMARGGSTLNLNDVERRAIEAAITRAGGHRRRAADLLGISRRTLNRKMRCHRLCGRDRLFVVAEQA